MRYVIVDNLGYYYVGSFYTDRPVFSKRKTNAAKFWSKEQCLRELEKINSEYKKHLYIELNLKFEKVIRNALSSSLSQA